MKKNVLNIIFKIRAFVIRNIMPGNAYYLFQKRHRTIHPLSGKFGFDRGTPIDRYWIEMFLEKNKKLIKGRVLEVTDNNYTKKYGERRVKRSDVLDINSANKNANIIADLRNTKDKIADNTYDCIVLTHVLGLIDNYQAVIKECHRILKKGGRLLFTGSCIGPVLENNEVFWRFTEKSTKYIFEKYFKPTEMMVETYGNALSGQAFWVGMAIEDLTKEELIYQDKRFPCVVSAVITK